MRPTSSAWEGSGPVTSITPDSTLFYVGPSKCSVFNTETSWSRSMTSGLTPIYLNFSLFLSLSHSDPIGSSATRLSLGQPRNKLLC
ncbi:hypothetical protein GDO81_019384 [Engystomops pustulosus]|uniref:Uncharacterized protein n=1 Tax=Engystomops pustulosus TaxID=76066 RepID=A0AAV6YA40_ENGPU|nr:hypothetical protein GDO81_019384 [Engystomops pustulosus]